MSASVCVLCPNGHRVNVDVRPNTPLSSIKQQACEKQGFDSANFGLRRENQKCSLDLSFPFRLSGLPNKAKLELVEESHKAELVNIALQLDTGQRLLGKCLNSSTLKDAIHSIGGGVQSVSFIMYLQRKIGSSEISTLKLSDLGIFKGSALLRLQNVHLKTDLSAGTNTLDDIKAESNNTVSVMMDTDIPVEKASGSGTVITEMDLEVECNKTDAEVECNKTDAEVECNKTDHTEVECNKTDVNKHYSMKVDVSFESAPILFNPATSAQSSSTGELEEDFFDASDRDLKIMLRDLHRISEREFRFKEPKKEKEVPEKAVFRIRFPNGTMLQNIFNARVDTTDTLYECVRGYLTTETSDNLTLYQAPPKQIIKPGITLVEAGLCTTSLLHAGGSIVLKSDLTVESDVTRAMSQLTGVLGVTTTPAQNVEEKNSSGIPQQSPSSSRNKAAVNNSGKPVPKWFKMK